MDVLKTIFQKIFDSAIKKIRSKNRFDDFLDNLIAKEVIRENHYLLWDHGNPTNKELLTEIFSGADTNLKIAYELLEKIFNEDLKDVYEDCVKFGEFPNPPEVYFTRKNLVDTLRKKIVLLEWNTPLIIHGPFGYGKSSLTADALLDTLICSYFDYDIFWLDLRELDTINTKEVLWTLYRRIIHKLEKKMYITEPEYNIEAVKNYQKLQYRPEELIDLQSELKILLKLLKNPLLVLDNANDNNIIDYFYFHVPTVITTQNEQIWPKKAEKYLLHLEISEEECLDLFRKYFTDPNIKMIDFIKELRRVTKGHPMLLALTLVYLNEYPEESKDVNKVQGNIWEQVIAKFKAGQYTLDNYRTRVEDLVGMCVDKLTPTLKVQFFSLVVFKEDVNIHPDVLQILFKTQNVREIMNQFTSRSLVARYYHEGSSYIYNIHIVIVKYLQDNCTADFKIAVHRKLLEDITIYDYKSKLEEHTTRSKYLLQYFAFHLKEAERDDLFSLYFNPEFLELKIKAAGQTDTLMDLTNYKYKIMQNKPDSKLKLENLVEFVKKYGSNIYNYLYVDYTQCALQEPKTSEIYKDIAKRTNNSRLYFEIDSVKNVSSGENYELPTNSDLAILLDNRFVLYGQKDGLISLFSLEFKKNKDNFSGHVNSVKKLEMNSDNKHLLSLSYDRTVKLWRVQSDFSIDNPRCKQENYRDLFLKDNHTCIKSFKLKTSDYIVTATFPSNFSENNMIITGTNEGNVIFWDIEKGEKICDTTSHGKPITSILFFENKSLLFSDKTNVYYYEFNSDTKKLFFRSNLPHKSQSCFISLFHTSHTIFGLTEKCIIIWKDEWHSKHLTGEEIVNVPENEQYNLCGKFVSLLNYLFIGTNESVQIWSFNGLNLKKIDVFPFDYPIKYLDVKYNSNNSEYILLVGNETNKISCYRIQYPQESNHVLMCDSNWHKTLPFVSVVNQGSLNCLQIYQGCNFITDVALKDGQITATCFSLNGNCIVLGLGDGSVHNFDMRNKSTKIMFNCLSAIIFLKYFHFDSTSASSLSLETKGVLLICEENHTVTAYLNEGSRTQTIPLLTNLFHYQELSFIVVQSDGQILLWNLNDNQNELITKFTFSGDTTQNKVSTAAISPCKTRLAISMQSNKYHKLDIMKISDSQIKSLKRFNMTCKTKTMCFSSDASLLAIGTTSGTIQVAKLNKINSPFVELAVYEQRSDVVSGLIFSSKLFFLAAVIGNQFTVWNLNSLHDNSNQQIERLSSNELDQNLRFLSEKEPLRNTKYLLAAVKLPGNAKLLSASKTFSSFLTVHDNGNINYMKIFKPSTTP